MHSAVEAAEHALNGGTGRLTPEREGLRAGFRRLAQPETGPQPSYTPICPSSISSAWDRYNMNPADPSNRASETAHRPSWSPLVIWGQQARPARPGRVKSGPGRRLRGMGRACGAHRLRVPHDGGHGWAWGRRLRVRRDKARHRGRRTEKRAENYPSDHGAELRDNPASGRPGEDGSAAGSRPGPPRAQQPAHGMVVAPDESPELCNSHGIGASAKIPTAAAAGEGLEARNSSRRTRVQMNRGHQFLATPQPASSTITPKAMPVAPARKDLPSRPMIELRPDLD